MNVPSNIAFQRLAREILDRHTQGTVQSKKEVAARLEVGYRGFMHWTSRTRNFPAVNLARFCTALNDFTLLDELERQAGRVSFAIPTGEKCLDAEYLDMVQKLVKEVGEALQELARTLEDHVVRPSELERTLPELDDVIRECVRLKYWLERSCNEPLKNSAGA